MCLIKLLSISVSPPISWTDRPTILKRPVARPAGLSKRLRSLRTRNNSAAPSACSRSGLSRPRKRASQKRRFFGKPSPMPSNRWPPYKGGLIQVLHAFDNHNASISEGAPRLCGGGSEPSMLPLIAWNTVARRRLRCHLMTLPSGPITGTVRIRCAATARRPVSGPLPPARWSSSLEALCRPLVQSGSQWPHRPLRSSTMCRP